MDVGAEALEVSQGDHHQLLAYSVNNYRQKLTNLYQQWVWAMISSAIRASYGD